MPSKAPEVKNSAPRLVTAKLLRTSLPPMSPTPTMPAHRTPTPRMIHELTMAMAPTSPALRPPMKESTAGVERPRTTRASCMTPQLYVVPMAHHASTEHAATTTQP